MSFRLRGFLWHLSASLLVAMLSIALVFGVWYPLPLHKALGVINVFMVLLAVDVVLGPLLTLVVCKEGKKSLVFDLAVIVVLQASALVYGIYTVAEGRPVWIVFNGDRFDAVQAYQLRNPYLAKAKPEYQNLSFTGPKWVAARQPEDLEQRNNLTFESVFAGIDIPQRPDLYVPYEQEAPVISSKAQELRELNNYNDPVAVNAVLAKWPDANAFIPLMCRVKPMTVLINRTTAKVIAVVDLNPWQ